MYVCMYISIYLVSVLQRSFDWWNFLQKNSLYLSIDVKTRFSFPHSISPADTFLLSSDKFISFLAALGLDHWSKGFLIAVASLDTERRL